MNNAHVSSRCTLALGINRIARGVHHDLERVPDKQRQEEHCEEYGCVHDDAPHIDMNAAWTPGIRAGHEPL
jgi:hypothetical protein